MKGIIFLFLILPAKVGVQVRGGAAVDLGSAAAPVQCDVAETERGETLHFGEASQPTTTAKLSEESLVGET